MSPTAAPDVTAAPSPAPAIPESGAAYDKWRQTGELPSAESAPAREESAEGDEPEGKHAPAPEAGKPKEPQAKLRGNAETRLQELLADLRQAGLSPAELKTFKREHQRQEAAAPAKVEPPKAEQPKPKADRPPRPKFGERDNETWEQYQARDTEWVESVADYAVQRYRAQQAEETQQKELRQQVDAAKGRYGAEADAAIGQAIDSLVSSDMPGVVKRLINDSPVLIDLAYVMGSKPEDLKSFLELAKSNPSAAIRRVVLMEKLVQEELVKGSTSGDSTGDRDETGKFTSRKEPQKKTTAAPPPPVEVSGRGSAPPDEEAVAAKTGDFEAFRAARNRADMERLRGR